MNAKYAGGGVLASVSAESDDQSVAVALEAVKAVAGLASKAASFAAARPPAEAPANETADDKKKRVEKDVKETCDGYKKLAGQRAELLGALASVQTPTLERALQEVDVAINAYHSYYYTGVTTKFATQRRFHYLPNAAASAPPELVQFSQDGGVCSVDPTLLNGPAFPGPVTASSTACLLSRIDSQLETTGWRL